MSKYLSPTQDTLKHILIKVWMALKTISSITQCADCELIFILTFFCNVYGKTLPLGRTLLLILPTMEKGLSLCSICFESRSREASKTQGSLHQRKSHGPQNASLIWSHTVTSVSSVSTAGLLLCFTTISLYTQRAEPSSLWINSLLYCLPSGNNAPFRVGSSGSETEPEMLLWRTDRSRNTAVLSVNIQQRS